MDYAEFWILETAVEMGVPFSRIVGPRDSIEAQWNKPYHDLTRADMLNLLDGLARNGDIVAGCDRDSRFIPSRSQIDDWLIYAHPLRTRRWFYLTPQGGARWEHYAHADWDRYHSYEWDSENVLELAATSPATAKRAFDYVPAWNDLRVFPETVKTHTLSPWSATYWKTLPAGYAITFRCEEFEELDEMHAHFFGDLSETEKLRFQSRIRREQAYFQNWYTAHPQTPGYRVRN